jgi:thiamine monophosphate kinase
MAETVADLGEHALIEHIRARVGKSPEWITLGIGDDAAVIEPDADR